MADKKLIRGGTVLSMDPQIRDLVADVLVVDDRIVAVEPDIDADAEVVDASGCIVLPGFVDTHRHTWETALRGCARNSALDDYFVVEVLDTFAPRYRPVDVHASNVAGALECLDAGITTLVDWSHINNTPDHPDAAISALRETGIRAQYAYGSANLSLADYWFDSKIAIPATDLRRIRGAYFSSDRGLMTLGMAARGPDFCAEEVVRAEWALARELAIPITIHVARGPNANRCGMISVLDDYGLLGEDLTYVHSCHASDAELDRVKETNGRIAIAPQVEVQMGSERSPLRRGRQLGLRPSLAIDSVTVPADMFTQMRFAFRNDRHQAEEGGGQSQGALSARDILEAATIDGAYVAGVEDRAGSLTPGKQADIVVIDAHSLSLASVDPVAAVVLHADVCDVGTVMVAGRFRKRAGKLLADVTRARADVEASTDYLLSVLTANQPA
jgi:cytosine/adenosine deaminase-related metal-dependent hydrolase